MKILVIKSSPHKKGSSNMLADQFIKGAEENGHEVETFDAGHADLHPCLGCDYCGTAGPCCQQDDMEALKDMIRRADLIAFVTPLYYYGMSTQLKMVIDRFYSFNGELQGMRKKCVMISAAWDNASDTFAGLEHHYGIVADYLNMTDCGAVYGGGCGTTSMTAGSKHMRAAYELGKQV